MCFFRYIHILIVVLSLFSCSSYKGMGDKDVDTLSQESSFMVSNFVEETLNEWYEGKEFVCIVDELPTLLEPQKGAKEDYSKLKDSIFRYIALREVQTWKGVETHIVYESSGLEFYYTITKPISNIGTSNYIPLLPELVSVDYISKADSLLKGKEIYIKTANWYSVDGVEKRGRRLIPVMVECVEAGNKVFPLSVIFKTKEGELAKVYTTMYNGRYTSQYSTYDKLFTFDNPRDKYPQIKDNIWELITQSSVTLGMTKDECQISLGLPDKVEQIPEYSGLRERWSYKTGTYLEFKDGLLVKYRLI